MTFRGTYQDKTVRWMLKKVPLIEENANELLSEVQNKFFQFSKDYDELNEYCRNIINYGKKDYDLKKAIITTKIKMMPETCKNLNNLITQLSKLEINDLILKKKVKDQLQIVKEKLLLKEREIPKILNNILDKENLVSKRMNFKE